MRVCGGAGCARLRRPDAWFANPAGNGAYARSAPIGGRLDMPVLFLHAAYDWICNTSTSRLAEPMRESCTQLIEATIDSGHWMQQERPREVNAALLRWLLLVGVADATR